jgi:EAL and modified HD-GYP domain-containing signal transduction protein
MEVFVGRQPILDRALRTYAYELLFRRGELNSSNVTDADAATAAVISNTFLSVGADKILGDCKGFVNLPQNLLADEVIRVLPRETVIVEILEDVIPDAEVVRACRNLKDAGYQLALDDFVRGPESWRLIELADFIKVDFRATARNERRALAETYGRGGGIHMLAEKVESQAEYEEARSIGYSYFQGYFFAKPQVISAAEVPATKLNQLRVLHELQHAELEFKRLEELVRQDLSLAPKILRYVNSAALALNQRVSSIMQALVILGEQNIRKLIALAIMAGLVSNRPPELVWTSFTRARLCEGIAGLSRLADRKSDCFLMGLFSLLDAMIGRPIADVFQELGMPAEILAAVAGAPSSPNVFSTIYRLCLACEAGDMPEIDKHSRRLGLPLDKVSDLNLDAMTWSELLCGESGLRH